MKILSLADVELGLLYNSSVKTRFSETDLVISCGDLPFYYLDFIASSLNRPLYFVYGNHHNEKVIQSVMRTDTAQACNGTNLHCRCLDYDHELLLGGIEGCLRYNNGKRQYTQREMWKLVYAMIPRLFFNRMKYGRFIDLFVTHASPWQIHDDNDRAHIGIKAFRWFDQTFQPQIHLHGHIHLYRNDAVRETVFCRTRVINSYGYRELEFSEGHFL